MKSRGKEINGETVRAEVHSYVVVDTHRDGIGEQLLPCNDWEEADFRWPNPVAAWREKHAIACNVHVTGRTIQRDRKVRCEVEWVGDGEPNTFSRGWLYLGS